jgi:multisubunit Na+/H+ antiporter MnhE subunit
MNRLQAMAILLWRFASAMVLSAWATSVTILIASDAPRRGFARLDYADLNEAGVMLLAAMVTLTPGTTTVDIDTDRRELLLHVLDSEDIETALADIKLKFMHPIRILFGGRS